MVGSTQEKVQDFSEGSPEQITILCSWTKNPGQEQMPRTWRVALPKKAQSQYMHLTMLTAVDLCNPTFMSVYLNHLPLDIKPDHKPSHPTPSLPVAPPPPAPTLLFSDMGAELTKGRNNRGPNSLGWTHRGPKSPEPS